MIGLRTVISICLLIYANCEDTPETTSTPQTTSNGNNGRSASNEISPVSTSDFTTTEANSSSDTDIPSIGVSDTIITGAITPESTVTEDPAGEGDEQQNSTFTSYDDFNTTTDFTTTEDINITACTSDPCRNGGTCLEDASNPYYLFSCNCPTGFVGIRCGTTDSCVTHKDGQLCKNGACVYSKDGLQRSCQCFPGTYWDKVYKECRESDLPCFPNPCLNDGVCSTEEDAVVCDCPSGFQGRNCSVRNKCGECENGTCVLDEKRTTMYCKCDEGSFWNKMMQSCEIMMSPCDSSPCLNGGSCDVISDTEYNCTCDEGFSGKLCDVLDKCSIREDCGHGNCTLSEDKKTRLCHCDAGYFLEEKPHICKAITNVCQPNPCQNDGICTPLSSSTYNCTCSEEYTGTKCDVRDLCKMDGGDAFCNNGLCGNNFELGVYYCTCRSQEYFQYAERKCVELDMCPLMQCGSSEKCSMSECICKSSYKWSNETEKCEADFCSSNPCPVAEMICEEGTGSNNFKCSCRDGYSFNGTHCKEVTCIFPKLNACDQTCTLTEGGYDCSCADEFELKEDNHTCLITGNLTCLNKTCDKGVCLRKEDMDVCLCPPGFIEVDGKCADKCSSGALESGICPMDQCEATTENGFMCKCEGKFSLSNDKTTCMVRNVCQENEIGWKTCTSRNAECVKDWEASDGYLCKCGNGKIMEGGKCQDICSLENNQRQCSIRGATCDVDSKGKMICRCPPYFKANERDGKCTQPADFSYLITLPLDRSTYESSGRQGRSLDASSVDYWKVSKDVTITMREMFAEFTQAQILSCKSQQGYVLCKVELQFSSAPKSDLKRLETEDVCLTHENSDQCLLPPALVVVKKRISTDVVIQKTDPCEQDIKGLVCGSDTTCTSDINNKSFNCSCQDGFYARKKSYQFGNTRSFIEACTDVDECSVTDPCPANSICVNTIGSFTCSCKPGFRDVNAASNSDVLKCVEICSPNPCTHGQCSTRGDHEFDCKCEAGYRGALCDLKDENFKRARNNTIIVGVVLGGILLITLILFGVCVSRLRKRKYLENPGHMYYNSAEMTERRRGEGGAINNAFQRE